MRGVAISTAMLLGGLTCTAPAPVPEAVSSIVRTGAERLADEGFTRLAGRRIGLIANHTSRVDSVHLADRLAEAGISLVALFGPEHGMRGDAAAGAEVADGRDLRTGVPVYSLYGSQRRPSPAHLADVDVLVFDIQDVGARFYTYISTMGLAMQAAAEAGVEFLVLDRPNPLGGDLVEGFVLEEDQASFVGAYPIPIVHGLTVGELARMVQGEQWLDGLDALVLDVVPMTGWRRKMKWTDIGRPWIPTSPNIPDAETAYLYPGTCLFEAVAASEGRGTPESFRLLGAPWVDAGRLADTLEAAAWPGLRADPTTFTPEPMPGRADAPRFAHQPLHGVRLGVTDAGALRPVAVGVALVEAFYRQAPPNVRAEFLNAEWMDRLAGTRRLRVQLTEGVPAREIAAGWGAEVEAFRLRRAPYLLYD
jgi:uncharacterized protein YbbC (DUF1343 family)